MVDIIQPTSTCLTNIGRKKRVFPCHIVEVIGLIALTFLKESPLKRKKKGLHCAVLWKCLIQLIGLVRSAFFSHTTPCMLFNTYTLFSIFCHL